MFKTMVVLTLVCAVLMGAAYAHMKKDAKQSPQAKKNYWQDPNVVVTKFDQKAWWGNSSWKVSFDEGRLTIKGPGYGYWDKKTLLIDNGVTHFIADGTGYGPMVVYKQGNNLNYVIFKGDTGKVLAKETLHKDDVKHVTIKGHYDGAYVTVTPLSGQVKQYWVTPSEKKETACWNEV